MAKAALLIVDFQNDFAAEDGALAVSGGMSLLAPINELLARPFAVKVATQDWHPRDHISFASNHPPPDNTPFESAVRVSNPLDPSQSEQVRLWPDHCIQGTAGAELVPGLDVGKVHAIVKKGQDKRVEMFSAFHDSYETCVADSGLLATLREAGVIEVYCVGIAFEHCVKETAIHAARHGFKTFVVEDATRASNRSEQSMERTRSTLTSNGVELVSMGGIAV